MFASGKNWGIANILTVNWSRRESKCELFLMLLFIFCSKLRAADIVCAWVRFAAKDGLVRQAGGRRAGSWGLTRKDGARQIYSCGHPHPHPPNRQTFTSTLCCKCCQKTLAAAAAVLAHEKLYQCNQFQQFQCTHLFQTITAKRPIEFVILSHITLLWLTDLQYP